MNTDESFLEAKKNELVGEQSSVAFKNPAGAWEPLNRSWTDVDANYKMIPEKLLKHAIVFVPRNNPLILKRFSPEQLEKYDAKAERIKASAQRLNYER